MARLINFIAGHDARHRIILGSVAGVAVFLLSTNIIAAWDTFAFCVLAAAWLTIRITPQQTLCARGQEEDFGRTVIFVFVVVAACASLFAVGLLVREGSAGNLVLGLATVVLSWSLVQTVFGLHYAHAYYGDKQGAGGLVFPLEPTPDYFDFAYFSFVIGMTCQVSDVQITSHRMRRLALLQSVLAFAFNTIILALLINTVFDLVKGFRSGGK
jgi:uncharacterized membrane protein